MTVNPHQLPTLDFTFLNPRPLEDIAPESWLPRIQDAMFEKPEYFEIDERELYSKLRLANKVPTVTDNCIRMKFWIEWEKLQASGHGKISVGAVCSGICSPDFIAKKYMKDPSRVAWLLCPPINYVVKLEEALLFATERMRDALDVPHIIGGKPQVKVMELQYKIWSALEMRKHGAYTQKNLNINYTKGDSPEVSQALEGATMEELETKLKQLRAMDRKAQNLPSMEAQLVDEPQKSDA